MKPTEGGEIVWSVISTKVNGSLMVNVQPMRIDASLPLSVHMRALPFVSSKNRMFFLGLQSHAKGI